MYNTNLCDLPIGLPEQQDEQIYQEYIIRIDDMWGFKEYMDRQGIEAD